jgi:hypothetical protein
MVWGMTCEKITYYIEKGYLTKLNVSEKIQIKLHSMYCGCCKAYPKDSKALNEILKKLESVELSGGFTESEKENLKSILKSIG